MSPNYGSVMLNSPLGGGPLASQISPGQRPMQPPFSPHGTMGTANSAANYQHSPQGQIVNNNGGSGGAGSSGGGGVGGNTGNNFNAGGPSSRLSPFNSAQVSPRVGPTQQQNFSQQQQQQQQQLSPQPGVGARSSPGIPIMQGQQQPSPGVGTWNSMSNNRPNLQAQRQQSQHQQQQQQQQHMLNYGQGIRNYAPRPTMRSLPSPTGGPNAIRPSYGNGMDSPAGPPTSNGMFVRQQQQQQQHHQQHQQQQQQMRLQRTVSAPSGVIPGECLDVYYLYI